jgi:beta-xylosidase
VIVKGKSLQQAAGVHQLLLSQLFLLEDEFSLRKLNYHSFMTYKKLFDKSIKAEEDSYYQKQEKKFLNLIPYTAQTLNEKGILIFEQTRGFEQYLKKVEEPYLRQMLM